MNNYFELVDGRIVTDEKLAERLNIIAQEKPESKSETDTGYEQDERGMAELFALCYKNECRYCAEKKCWFVYENGRWIRDDAGLFTMGKLTEFTRLMSLYVPCIESPERRESYGKFVAKLGDRRFRDRILKDAINELIISATDFDANPYLINCKNGTYDLKTGSWHEHTSDDLLTMMTNFSYRPWDRVRCPRWTQFIDDIMQGDKEKTKHLQKCAGYSMLGKSNEEMMIILYGRTTRNGKSTFLNTLNYMLGDYSDVSPVSIICKNGTKAAETASPMIASLKGKRMVTMAESNQYGKLDEEAIKQLTGGEEIKARNLYEKPITFLPQFTMWLSCNDLPMFTDKSIIASDRIHVITFDRHFSHAEQDKNLKNFFCEEENMRGIFEWLIEGYKLYCKEGLEMPGVVQKAVTQYARDNDLVLQFLEDKCVMDSDVTIRAKSLYDNYKMWCKNNGSYQCSARKFNAEMDAHTEWYGDKRIIGGYPTYCGLKLRGE